MHGLADVLSMVVLDPLFYRHETFTVLEYFTAMSIIQGGNWLPCLDECVYNYLSGGESTGISVLLQEFQTKHYSLHWKRYH